MNEAKKLLESIGLPIGEVRKQAHGDKNPSATKSGPGRYHVGGHEKDRPASNKGAPAGFVLHTASAAKKERRELIAAHGRRYAIKAIKHWKREHAAANDERTDARSTRHYESLEVAA